MKPKAAPRFSREQWLLKALDVLAEQGPAKLNIETLCQALGVSRGSFYWHFADRAEFVSALLELWFQEYTARVPERIEAGGGTARERFRRLVHLIHEQDLTRFDLPIRSWALQEPSVAERVKQTDGFRLDYVRTLFSEMGFRGHAREVRARSALAYLAMDQNLVLGLEVLPAGKTADLIAGIFCDGG